MDDPVERLLALLPQRRAPYLAACVAAAMVLAPFLIIYFGATQAETQERPRTVPPPSYAELENNLRNRITRNADIVMVRTAIAKNGGDMRILPWPVPWSIACDGGLLTVTVGTPEGDGGGGILFPTLFTSDDCKTTAINAARILRQILN